MSENGARKWIDFEELKKTASVEAVLSALGLLDDMVKVGSEWKGQCPFHKGEGNIKPFCFNEEKRVFHCFACKRKGNVLDFVSQYLTHKGEKTGVRQAAEYIVSAMESFTPARESVKEEERKPEAGEHSKGKGKGAEESASHTGEDIPPVMSFSLASRLIIANKIKPEHLLVIDMDAVGIEWKKAKRE